MKNVKNMRFFNKKYNILQKKGEIMLKALTIKDDEKFLRQISKPVDFNDGELKQNIHDIKEFCENYSNCYAMACVQLGIAKRIVCVRSSKEGDTSSNENFLLINPEIISQRGKTEFWEACVSGLDNFALVERPYELTIKYQDEEGNTKIQRFEGFASTVLSHELDHLDGIFHMDRAKKLYIMPQEERAKFRRTHPYKVLSKTCEFHYGELKNKQTENAK